MKRPLIPPEQQQPNTKKLKLKEPSSHHTTLDQDEPVAVGFMNFDDNILYEIFKHADARTLGVASCVSKTWNQTAQDERLWEMICTRHWASGNYIGGAKHLRSVVLALGGFRRLYALYLSKTVSTSQGPHVGARAGGRSGVRWGKDEVNLSLSLLSIRYYEKMNFGPKKK